MPRLFVAQSALDRWIDAGGISLDADVMRLSAAPSVAFFVNPAVYFVSIDGGTQDPFDIIGACKTSHELAQMGADHYETSVLIGENSYTVVPGFVGVPVGADGAETQLDGGTWGAVAHAIESLGYT